MKLIKMLFILLVFIFNYGFALNEFVLTRVEKIDGNFQDVFVYNNKLYTLSSNTLLKIYDIKNPANPYLLSEFDTKREGKSIAVYKGYLYMGDGKGNAIFFNVKDIYDIYVEFSYSSVEHQNYGIVAKGSLAYEANGRKGINIININDPFNATIIGSYTDLVDARDVDIKDDYLYIADGNGGLTVLDVKDPKNPKFVIEVSLEGFAEGLKVKDNFVLIADNEGGLQILDISNPYMPVRVYHNYSPNDKGIKAVAFKNNYLYLAKGDNGLDIVKVEVRDYQVSKEDIKPFIELLYKKILGRDADESGLNYWVLQVQKGRTATSIAKYFFESPEFQNLALTNEEFIKRAYSTLLNREPDPSGIKYWLGQMENGVSKEQIFYGFAFSKEFQNLAGNIYKINPFNQDDQLKAFVGRFYNFVLGRDADEAGRDFWVHELKIGKKNAKDIALGFFNSKEFKNKNVSNDEFVKIVYKTILGRDADDRGLKYWVSQLEKGVSRNKIILGFLSSKEFKKIANSYGLKI